MGPRRIIPRFSLRTLVIFMLLVTSGTGLWWHWEAWPIVCRASLPPDFFPREVEHVSDRFMVIGYYETWDQPDTPSPALVLRWARFALDSSRGNYFILDGEASSTWEDTWKFIEPYALPVSPDGERRVAQGDTSMAIVSATDAEKLADLQESPGPFGGGPVVPVPAFSSDGREVAAAAPGSVMVYRRRRPEWWWGVFWLWEFWLTVVFGLLLTWSVWRDRKALRKEAA